MRAQRDGAHVPEKLDFNHYMHFFTGEDDRDAFPSPETAKAAWDYHRDEVMDRPGVPAGTRPRGYWAYERGEDYPESRVESVRSLLEAGELTDEEREKILAQVEWWQECDGILPCERHVATSPPQAVARIEESRQRRYAEALELGRLLDAE